MATMITIKINERTKAGRLVKELLSLLKNEPGVEVMENESPMNPEFVKRIKQAEKGKGREMTSAQELWESIK